ncbi:rbm25 protein [Anaeramoeba flamelloides]|uniref:Rbm25 protein n=1 Tax=Anaeramoeba flamelloides TaxID=1746091 RepID=A0ABQ8Y505_9EUKA|nr:rbm25 protein [Anaeramoeba flamelloides]
MFTNNNLNLKLSQQYLNQQLSFATPVLSNNGKTTNSTTAVTSVKPENITTIYVGKIPTDVDDSLLTTILNLCGFVFNWKRVLDPISQQPKSFGYCDFFEAESALTAILVIPECLIQGNKLVLTADSKNKELIRVVERKRGNKQLNKSDKAIKDQISQVIKAWETEKQNIKKQKGGTLEIFPSTKSNLLSNSERSTSSSSSFKNKSKSNDRHNGSRGHRHHNTSRHYDRSISGSDSDYGNNNGYRYDDNSNHRDDQDYGYDSRRYRSRRGHHSPSYYSRNEDNYYRGSYHHHSSRRSRDKYQSGRSRSSNKRDHDYIDPYLTESDVIFNNPTKLPRMKVLEKIREWEKKKEFEHLLLRLEDEEDDFYRERGRRKWKKKNKIFDLKEKWIDREEICLAFDWNDGFIKFLKTKTRKNSKYWKMRNRRLIDREQEMKEDQQDRIEEKKKLQEKERKIRELEIEKRKKKYVQQILKKKQKNGEIVNHKVLINNPNTIQIKANENENETQFGNVNPNVTVNVNENGIVNVDENENGNENKQSTDVNSHSSIIKKEPFSGNIGMNMSIHKKKIKKIKLTSFFQENNEIETNLPTNTSSRQSKDVATEIPDFLKIEPQELNKSSNNVPLMVIRGTSKPNTIQFQKQQLQQLEQLKEQQRQQLQLQSQLLQSNILQQSQNYNNSNNFNNNKNIHIEKNEQNHQNANNYKNEDRNKYYDHHQQNQSSERKRKNYQDNNDHYSRNSHHYSPSSTSSSFSSSSSSFSVSSSSSSSFPSSDSNNKKKRINPKESNKGNIFDIVINWEEFEKKSILKTIIEPFVTKIIFNLFGEKEGKFLVEYILEQVQNHANPQDLILELEQVIDKESGNLVKQIWELIRMNTSNDQQFK